MKIEKLELKHLAPYLPYGLKGWKPYLNRRSIVLLGAHNIISFLNDVDFIELRPLSQLTEEIEVNGEKFVPVRLFIEIADGFVSDDENIFAWWHKYINNLSTHPYRVHNEISQLLIEWHFDIFNLIENNLAIEKK